MATALFLTSQGRAPVVTTPSGDWDHSATYRRQLRAAPRGSPITSVIANPDPYPAVPDHPVDADALLGQFVSGVFPAQVIAAQQLFLSIVAWQFGSTFNLYLAWKLFALSVDGTTALGTLLSLTRTSALEFDGNTEASRTGRTDVRTSTAFDSGSSPFRLALEVGAGGTPGSDGAHNFAMRIGDPFSTGPMTLVGHGAGPGSEVPMLVFSEELDPPVDDTATGGVFGYPILG